MTKAMGQDAVRPRRMPGQRVSLRAIHNLPGRRDSDRLAHVRE